MNRFTQISTSAYKPLDLSTIMLIPTQKQIKHDAAQASINEYSSLQANRLQQDAQAVDERLNKFKQSANEISSSLLERGIDRSTIAKLNKLKADKDKEFSQQGLIGNAQANYNTATQFVKDLTEKKERQAGWSPARAKQWAQSQVASFAGTDSGDGKFNSFSGRELEDYVDTNKWITDNIKNVAANIDPITLRRYGGVGGFETAWVSGKVKSLDAYKIIKSLGVMAQYDDKLQSSLKQSGYFNGDKDPTNIGSYKIVKGNDGKNREVFVPGSRFGAQLQAAAHGASYKETDLDYKMVTDHVGLELMKKGMREKEANDMIVAVDQSLLNVPPITYDNLKTNLSIARTELDSNAAKLNERAIELKKAKGGPIDPNTDKVWLELKDANNKAMIKYNNAYYNLDAVDKKANAGMNNIQKRRNVESSVIDGKIEDMMSKIPSIGERARGLARGEDTLGRYEASELRKLGLNDNQIRSIQAKTSFDEVSYKYEVKKEVMIAKGLIFPKDKSSTFSKNKAYVDFINEQNKFSKKAKAYLKDNPAVAEYESFDGFANGAYKTITGAANEALTNSFNSHGVGASGKGWKVANTGASLDEFIEKNPQAKYRLSVTNGVDINGDPIETLTAVTKDGVFLDAIPVTRGKKGFILQRQVGESLKNSSLYKDKGARMVKNSQFLYDVGSLQMHQEAFTSGAIPNQELPDGTLPYIEKHKSKSGHEYFTFDRIKKNDYLGKDKKVVRVGNGNQVGGVDQVIDVLDAYQNQK